MSSFSAISSRRTRRPYCRLMSMAMEAAARSWIRFGDDEGDEEEAVEEAAAAAAADGGPSAVVTEES